MSIRFLADADLDEAIVTGLRERERAIDFMTANEANLRRRGDPFVLEFAANQGRILVSHDRRTMPVHFAARLRDGQVRAFFSPLNVLPWVRSLRRSY
jgi:hypothetical protein